MRKLILLFILSLMLTVSISSVHAKLYAKKDRALKDFEIPEYNAENLSELSKDINTLREMITEKLRAKGKKQKKINKDPLITACDFIDEELSEIKSLIQNGDYSYDTIRRYIRTMRVWYSVEADFREGEITQGRIESLTGKMVMFGRISASPLVIKLRKKDPDEKIGISDAENQSGALVNPLGKLVSREEIAGMTHRELSLLNPYKGNVLDLDSQIPQHLRYNSFVRTVEKMVRKFDKDYENFTFDEAKKVFFIDSIKTRATSPKVEIFDKFGIDWKLKWGDEVHTEPFMVNLYIALGGRYADIKFYVPRKSTPFILQPIEKNNEIGINYLYQFEEAMLNSNYEFHLERYVVEEGLLYDEQNRKLGHGIVDDEFINKYGISSKYKGTYFVYFKEASVSFVSPLVKRLGPAAFSEHGAENSRIARGSMIFNCFFKNKDCKDDNNRVVLMYNFKTKKFDIPIEYQSDLGCTMGSLRSSGQLNNYEWDFIVRFPGFYGFKMRTLYYPYAWNKCTFSDAMWMARNIVNIKDETYRSALKDSGWPEFVQRYLFEKLMSRRNELIDHFSLEKEGFKKKPVDKKLTLRVKLPDGTVDYPVKNGKIQSPENSVLVKQEVKMKHPEGLDKVISRRND